jgi:hypothetical protein
MSIFSSISTHLSAPKSIYIVILQLCTSPFSNRVVMSLWLQTSFFPYVLKPLHPPVFLKIFMLIFPCAPATFYFPISLHSPMPSNIFMLPRPHTYASSSFSTHRYGTFPSNIFVL